MNMTKQALHFETFPTWQVSVYRMVREWQVLLQRDTGMDNFSPWRFICVCVRKYESVCPKS